MWYDETTNATSTNYITFGNITCIILSCNRTSEWLPAVLVPRICLGKYGNNWTLCTSILEVNNLQNTPLKPNSTVWHQTDTLTLIQTHIKTITLKISTILAKTLTDPHCHPNNDPNLVSYHTLVPSSSPYSVSRHLDRNTDQRLY